MRSAFIDKSLAKHIIYTDTVSKYFTGGYAMKKAILFITAVIFSSALIFGTSYAEEISMALLKAITGR